MKSPLKLKTQKAINTHTHTHTRSLDKKKEKKEKRGKLKKHPTDQSCVTVTVSLLECMHVYGCVSVCIVCACMHVNLFALEVMKRTLNKVLQCVCLCKL